MPGFDGTGPRGMGPMTGGRRGLCAMPFKGNRPYGYGVQTPDYYTADMPQSYGPIFGAGRGGFPRGGGRGRVFGGGRGFRRWW